MTCIFCSFFPLFYTFIFKVEMSARPYLVEDKHKLCKIEKVNVCFTTNTSDSEILPR